MALRIRLRRPALERGDLARIGVQVLARPVDVPSLLRLGREAATALATLRRLARAAGPALFNAG